MDILSTIRRARQPYINLKNICRTSKTIHSESTVDLAHVVYGPTLTPDSEPIFVLHGVLASKKNWHNMCTRISDYTNKSVIAVDARNHGDSPHHVSHNYFDLAADLSNLISKLSIKKSIILGHSMGGRAAMVLALTEPSKIASLIVVDISPITTQTFIDFIPKDAMDIMMSVDFAGLKTIKKARIAIKNKIIESRLFPNEESLYLISTNLARFIDNSIGWKCNLKALYKNFNHIASFPDLSGKTYEGPTLFIGGKLSKFLPPDDIKGIRILFPHAKLLYIEGVWHNIHLENPKAFFDTVVQFLSTGKSQDQI